MAKIIRNLDTVSHTYAGQEILATSSYTIQSIELAKFINDDSLLNDIALGKAQINDGVADIFGVTEQIRFLVGTQEKINDQGYTVVAPTFEDAQGLTTIWKGHLYTVAPSALNIFDVQVTTQLKLRGGWYKIMSNTASVGDYIEFSIIDKDNVLGLFGMFGLVLGQDILELKKFVRTEYICPLSKERQEFSSNGASDIMEGLYFRTHYFNSGTQEVLLSITEKYHEA